MDHADEHIEIERAFEDLVRLSTLDIIVPKSKDIDANVLVQKYADELRGTPSRTTIFFDELTTVCIVLRTSALPSATDLLLPHLELTIAAYASNAAEGSTNATPVASKHEITVVKADAMTGLSTAKVGTATHIAWSQTLHVRRPRARLQCPAVYFTATLSLKAEYLERVNQAKKHFLPSFQSLPGNVLESLSIDSAGSDSKVYLSEARITKVAPPSPRTDDTKVLRGVSKRAFPAVPAIVPRLRCAAVGGSLYVSLQIETSQIPYGEVVLHDVSFDVAGADCKTVEPFEVATLRSGDEIALLYHVMEKKSLDTSNEHGNTSIAIKAIVKLEQGTEAELSLSWQTQIELTKPSSTLYCSWSDETGKESAGEQLTRRARDNSQSNGHLIFDISAPRLVPLTSGCCDINVKCINRSKTIRQLALRTNLANGSSLSNAITTTPDVRLGPIGIDECFETVVKYQLLKAGVLDLGHISMVDLISGKSVRIQDLPDVIAHE